MRTIGSMSPRSTIAHLLFSLGLNGAAAVSFRNRLINGNFFINQRGASNAPTVYPPGTFIRDRWKAGPAGCTAACVTAANGDTTIHIGKGTVRQDVEGALYLSEGGRYCLSWQGDAIGRIVVSETTPVFEPGQVVASDIPAGTNAIVEFSCRSGGPPVSLRLAQLEPGSTPTVFERRDDEAIRCRRYFHRIAKPPLRGVVCTVDMVARCGMPLSPTMVVVPKVSLVEHLPVFDGASVSMATTILTDYSTSESIELDLALSSELTVGRPAIFFAGQGGILDVDAEAVS